MRRSSVTVTLKQRHSSDAWKNTNFHCVSSMVRTWYRNLINFDEAIIFIISMMANGPEKWYYITLAACVHQPWLRDCVRNLRFRQTGRRIKEKRMQSMKAIHEVPYHIGWCFEITNFHFVLCFTWHLRRPLVTHQHTRSFSSMWRNVIEYIYIYLSNGRCEHWARQRIHQNRIETDAQPPTSHNNIKWHKMKWNGVKYPASVEY